MYDTSTNCILQVRCTTEASTADIKSGVRCRYQEHTTGQGYDTGFNRPQIRCTIQASKRTTGQVYDTGIRNILQVYVTGIRSRLQVYNTGTSSRLQVYDTGNNSRLTVRCTIQYQQYIIGQLYARRYT